MIINKKSRSEITLEWTAKYKDGSELKQFNDKTNQEYHFGHIEQEKLKEFVLTSKVDFKNIISVNLETGLFYLNGNLLKDLDIKDRKIKIGYSFKDKEVTKKKLIYFRQVRRDFDMGQGTMTATISYILGFEARVGKKNIKSVIQINSDGTIGIFDTPDKAPGFIPL